MSNLVFHTTWTWAEGHWGKNAAGRGIFWSEKGSNRTRQKMHNLEFRNLYSSPNITRIINESKIMWREARSDKKCVHRLDRNHEGKRKLRRPKREWQCLLKKDSVRRYVWTWFRPIRAGNSRNPCLHDHEIAVVIISDISPYLGDLSLRIEGNAVRGVL